MEQEIGSVLQKYIARGALSHISGHQMSEKGRQKFPWMDWEKRAKLSIL